MTPKRVVSAIVTLMAASLLFTGTAYADHYVSGSSRRSSTTTTTTVAPTTTTTVAAGEVLGETETTAAPATSGVSGGTLPFTGGDVLGLSVLGVGLIAVGAGMSRRRKHAKA